MKDEKMYELKLSKMKYLCVFEYIGEAMLELEFAWDSLGDVFFEMHKVILGFDDLGNDDKMDFDDLVEMINDEGFDSCGDWDNLESFDKERDKKNDIRRNVEFSRL